MWNYGETVKVKVFIDGIVERRVVGSTVGTVYLCNEDEFESAEHEGREPVAIGFPVEDVVENLGQPVS